MVKLWHLPLLFGTGFVAGFADSIAGGGGLITIPVLMNIGIDPAFALGTNKLQASFGSGSAAWHYARAGAVEIKDCGRGFAITFISAAAGTLLVQTLSRGFLERLIPVLLIAVAIYSLLRRNLGAAEAPARMKRVWFDVAFGILIGFYDGFFGPGTGTFWAVAYVLMLGFNFIRATAYTKVMNFASNLSSLIFFIVGGHVLFVPGIVMGVGQLLGARIGSHTVVKHGARFIRPIFIVAVLAITGKLIWQIYAR